MHCVWSQFLCSPSLHDLQNIKCHFVNGQLAVGSFFIRSQVRSDLASDFLETSNFLIYRLTLSIGNFGSNASINDAWHKKVNNMEMSSVKKVGWHLWINSVSMLFLCSEKPEESSLRTYKCNVCFSKPIYMRVVILLRSFNPPNVAKLKIDHVGIVVWYKRFDHRLIIQALWSSLDDTSTFIVARYYKRFSFARFNRTCNFQTWIRCYKLLFRPKTAH